MTPLAGLRPVGQRGPQGHSGMSVSASGDLTQAVWVGNKQHGRAKAVLPNECCEAHGDFVAGMREGLWLVVGPPDNGNLTTQTAWKRAVW